ncbi:short-chain dehydrogenase [Alsobacter metallidurans]|uniref:Short-chain dehydrogenase n=1 Tax=Alsobacter metallidurans TaxID=340221 RepID=A0A917I5Q0_9HYPH|nr:SDR family oxidoreductase [Alsobacter metallidurans]GGH17336.1 short-chain dehydrogenase [Alsobacter metallidurans]
MVTNQSVLILGARSDIGRAIAHTFAGHGRPIVLAARRAADLNVDVADISARYQVAASAIEFDVIDGGATRFFDSLPELPDVVVMVAGLLGDQAVNEVDQDAAMRVMATNYTGPACYLLEVARRMEARGSGAIVGISSVAGDRGRRSNFVYGSAKAGFTAFLSGLRNRLAAQNIQVVTIKPGFVATRMTAGMKLPPALTAAPQEVADATWRAVTKGSDVVYVRSVWRLIMWIIRSIPERLFKRLSL